MRAADGRARRAAAQTGRKPLVVLPSTPAAPAPVTVPAHLAPAVTVPAATVPATVNVRLSEEDRVNIADIRAGLHDRLRGPMTITDGVRAALRFTAEAVRRGEFFER